MSPKSAAIRGIYAQVAAPAWAAPNLDGLADVLRDLSWLPAGTVTITAPDLGACGEDDRAALLAVLRRAVLETADGPRPVRIEPTGERPESG